MIMRAAQYDEDVRLKPRTAIGGGYAAKPSFT